MTSLPANGSRLCFDVGQARIGVAKCSADQILAVPVSTLKPSETLIAEIASQLIAEPVGAVYVGLPVNLSGQHTASTELAVEFASSLRSQIVALALAIPVHLIDERFSTTVANRNLTAAGKSARESRSVVDMAAAVEILNFALEIEKRDQALAGHPVQT